MCTSTNTNCKHCAHTRQHITLCDAYKVKQESLRKFKGYNYKDCEDLKEAEVEVDAFDGGHDCPAEFRERMIRCGGSKGAKNEEKNGKKKQPDAAGEAEKEENGGCVGM
ncbi:hypothetical protein IFR04_007916 [Cadophora malorum]|uniref:Uncharacterized protein n=1 Tax=Cadophora malorum TaxID=108018 RepID=A0A8H7TCB8_9HELO|nr:hypothetical protein IFR04_007916 [Cadophora malorum]